MPSTKEDQVLFWLKEMERADRFNNKHMDMLRYVREKKTDEDVRYFLPRYYGASQVIKRIHDQDPVFSTYGDPVISGWIAYLYFQRYVIRQLRFVMKEA